MQNLSSSPPSPHSKRFNKQMRGVLSPEKVQNIEIRLAAMRNLNEGGLAINVRVDDSPQFRKEVGLLIDSVKEKIVITKAFESQLSELSAVEELFDRDNLSADSENDESRKKRLDELSRMSR